MRKYRYQKEGKRDRRSLKEGKIMKNIRRFLLTMAAAAMVLFAPAGSMKAQANGNTVYGPTSSYITYTVSVQSGYLALRTAKAYDSSNEIGRLWNGDTVQVIDTSDSQYWYVYAPSLGKYGFVNKDYLKGASAPSSSSIGYTVKVSSGYLALRTAKAYDSSNEIGRLWTGDGVQVIDTSDSQYWYVYAPTLGKYGYVNKDYLVANSSSPSSSGITYNVRVQSGYLALRTAKAYDSSNEIGKLWTGDTVQVIDSSGSQYWYVYAPTLGKYGYVNKDYLYAGSSSSTPSSSYIPKTVHVQSGYLALRTAKAYDSSNEIGKLWNGESVQVIDTSDSQYWYVYAPTLGKYGYVNKDYLY